MLCGENFTILYKRQNINDFMMSFVITSTIQKNKYNKYQRY
jgi:hypothetical protein